MPHKHKRHKDKLRTRLVNGFLTMTEEEVASYEQEVQRRVDMAISTSRSKALADRAEQEEDDDYENDTWALSKDDIERLEKYYFKRKKEYMNDKIDYNTFFEFKIQMENYLKKHGSGFTVYDFDADYEVNNGNQTTLFGNGQKSESKISTGPDDMNGDSVSGVDGDVDYEDNPYAVGHYGNDHYGRYGLDGTWEPYNGFHFDEHWVKIFHKSKKKKTAQQKQEQSTTPTTPKTTGYPYVYNDDYDPDDDYGWDGDSRYYGSKHRSTFGYNDEAYAGYYGGYYGSSYGGFSSYQYPNCSKFKKWTYAPYAEKERIKEEIMKHWDANHKSPNPWLIIKPEVKQKMDLLCQMAGTYEIAWNGFVRVPEGYTREQNVFELYDVVVYPQIVSGATSETDTEEFGAWFENEVFNRPDFNNMRFHGHSHVNMACSPSSTDRAYRDDTLKDIEGDDFYFFGIYNKKGEFSMEMYDAKYHICWETADIYSYVANSLEELMDALEWSQAQCLEKCREIKAYKAETKAGAAATTAAKTEAKSTAVVEVKKDEVKTEQTTVTTPTAQASVTNPAV